MVEFTWVLVLHGFGSYGPNSCEFSYGFCSGRFQGTLTPALFRGSIERHGPGAFGMFSCSKATNEVNYMAQKFVRAVVGSNNIDSCNRT